MKAFKKLLFISALCLFLFSCSWFDPPVSVILMIGDGMGYEQVKAASFYYYGEEGKMSFESLPVKGSVSTYSANSSITDSAAAATAMATGQKVNNGVISKAIPGDGSNLETVLEQYKSEGKSVGVVTTAMVSHATPAAFTSHNVSRINYSQIADEIFTVTKPNVVFGGGGSSAGIDMAWLQTSGYKSVANEDEMNALSGELVCGLFGDGHMPYVYDGLGEYPTLSEMLLKALDLLDENNNGFFLMIEGGRIDHACHSNDLQRMLLEVKAFSDAAQDVLDWIGSRDDILLIVTADHETGGLDVINNNGEGTLPTVAWRTDYHTEVDVPVYGYGPGAEKLSGDMDNTGIFEDNWKKISTP